jgi:hypothetical protein
MKGATKTESTFSPGTWARFWTHIFRGIDYNNKSSEEAKEGETRNARGRVAPCWPHKPKQSIDGNK